MRKNSFAIVTVAPAHPCARDIRTSMSRISNTASRDKKRALYVVAAHRLIKDEKKHK